MNDVIDDLARLRAAAPASVLPAVLISTGLADRYVTRDSPLGTLYVAFTGDGVAACTLAESAEDFERSYRDDTGRLVAKVPSIPVRLEAHLDRALEEGRPRKLPLDLGGLTPFQREVLLKTAEIPPGEVRPYGWVAREIGRPGAVRAVGSALAKNPVPVIVPCHRVVRSDGSLGKYSLGDPENKRVLLRHEGMDTEGFEEMAAAGIRLTGSDTTKVYCHPTCAHARRTMAEHTIRFRDARHAEAAGYRPCKVCRPVPAAA